MSDRYDDLNPSAATAALRSFPRRFRTTLAADPTKDRDEIAALRAPDGRSVAEVVAGTVQALSRLGEVVRRVLVSEGFAVPAEALDDATASTASTAGASLSAVLDQLDTAAASVADPLASAPSAALLRTGTTPSGETISALDLARHAVRVGAENLRAVQKAMEAGGIELDTDDDNDS